MSTSLQSQNQFKVLCKQSQRDYILKRESALATYTSFVTMIRHIFRSSHVRKFNFKFTVQIFVHTQQTTLTHQNESQTTKAVRLFTKMKNRAKWTLISSINITSMWLFFTFFSFLFVDFSHFLFLCGRN